MPFRFLLESFTGIVYSPAEEKLGVDMAFAAGPGALLNAHEGMGLVRCSQDLDNRLIGHTEFQFLIILMRYGTWLRRAAGQQRTSRNLPMSPQNRRQAYLPETAVIMNNPVGTAPGFQLKIDRCVFFFMPGVPHEMRRMLADRVLPAIVRIRGEQQVATIVKTICTFGLPESVVDEKIADIPGRFPELGLGLRASFPYIQVKLYGRSADQRALARQIAAAQKQVCACLGDTVFSTEGQSLAEALGNMLVSRNATIAVAESCTGGLIAN